MFARSLVDSKKCSAEVKLNGLVKIQHFSVKKKTVHCFKNKWTVGKKLPLDIFGNLEFRSMYVFYFLKLCQLSKYKKIFM